MARRIYLLPGLLLVLLAGCTGGPSISQSAAAPAPLARPTSGQAAQPSALPPVRPVAPSPAPSPTVPVPSVTPSPMPSPTVPLALLATVTATGCPVTIANGNAPPRESAFPGIHGNGALWTSLWPNGIIRATPEYVQSDGSVDMKFWWWRGPTVRGPLTISGRRLDAPAPPLQADIPVGYGDTGFQASGIIFPTEGCWEVTGRAGNATLTFVTFVVKEQNQGAETGLSSLTYSTVM